MQQQVLSLLTSRWLSSQLYLIGLCQRSLTLKALVASINEVVLRQAFVENSMNCLVVDQRQG